MERMKTKRGWKRERTRHKERSEGMRKGRKGSGKKRSGRRSKWLQCDSGGDGAVEAGVCVAKVERYNRMLVVCGGGGCGSKCIVESVYMWCYWTGCVVRHQCGNGGVGSGVNIYTIYAWKFHR